MRTPFLAALALSSVTLAIDSAFAQPARLDTVVISGQRTRENSFDVPAAITAIDRETLDSAGPQVNLSEALNRVPGLTVLPDGSMLVSDDRAGALYRITHGAR